MTEEQKIAEDEQGVIDKISSFNYRELFRWIKTTLQGDDIPLYWRRSSPGKFLYHLFRLIKIENSREDFKTIHKRLIRDFEALRQKEGQI